MLTELPTVDQLWSQAPRARRFQRIVQLAPVRTVIGLLFLVPATTLAFQTSRLESAALRGVAALLVTAAYALSLAGFAKGIEQRKLHELSARRGFREWLTGFAIGLGLLSGTVGILYAVGAYRVGMGGDARALVSAFFGWVPQSLFEEIMFRAVIFKIAEESIGTRAALAIEAAFFGASHLGNPGATALGAIAIALEAGILLTAAFMLTRRLWLTWGLHVGWNYAQGSVFGIRVSGTPLSSSWLRSEPIGNDHLTGGAFGVEASPVAVVLCVAVAVLLLRLAIRRGQLVTWKAQRERVRALLAQA
jgi:membrane protease YdiL (CAAX protease family)